MLDMLRKISSLKNCNPKGLIDIGANKGEFSKAAKKFIRTLQNFYLIEANRECSSYLSNLPWDYKICLLSNNERNIDFFIDPNDMTSTGNSYYLEETEHFNKEILVKIKSTTLDKVISLKKEKFDFLKIDTQGSELDIIKGGLETLKGIEYILLECNIAGVKAYNRGSPDEIIIFNFLKKHGFKYKLTVDEHIWQNAEDKKYNIKCGTIFQKDIIFSKKKLTKTIFTRLLELKSFIKKMYIRYKFILKN